MLPELREILEEIDSLHRLSDMPRKAELCRHALSLLSHELYPPLWATLQVDLANALAQSPQGGRAENLEQAIFHFQQALEVYTRQAYPEQWAYTQNSLANAYSNRIRGERAENLEQAISHYQQALEIKTRHDYPEDWAMIQNNLATAYLYRIRGERTENLEQAIHHYLQVLQVRTRQAYPEKWSGTQNNLANAYRNRIRGERADNLEQAIYHYQQALQVRTRQAYPEDWAMTQNNIALAYSNRIRGERAENLEQAIHHCLQALEVYSHQAYPEDWAMTQNNLANTYRNRIRGDRAENLEQAFYHYQQALQVRTRQAYPEKWAMTQNNLAIAYLYRIRGERAENLEQAIYHYQQALQVRTRQAYPEDWAMTQKNLALTYYDRIRGDREENLEQAIFHNQQALQVYTRQAYPEQCRQTARNLCSAAFKAERWEVAIEGFVQAIKAQEALLRSALGRLGKLHLLTEMRGMPSRATYSWWKTGQPEKAVEALEAGRARLLGEALERQRRDLEHLSSLGYADLLERYRRAAGRYEALQRLGDTTTGHIEQTVAQRPADWLAQMEAASAELDAVIAEIQQVQGYETFLKTLTARQIRALAGDLGAPLIYLAATPAGGLAFIVTQQGVQAVELSALTEDALQKQVSGEEGQDAYLRAYLEWRSNLHEREKEKRWQATLDATCTWLGQAVMGPLVAALREVVEPEGQVILIPSDTLSLLPLHAAKLPASDAGKAETYALDHYAFTYAPSAQALHHAKEKSRSASAGTLMAVEDPRGDLPYTPDEVQAIRAHFGERLQHLPAQQATREAVRAAISAANVLHFSTHGMAGWGDAESARLLLADGELTLREVYDLKLDRARLAVLSACETAIPGLENPDEMIALPSGWMQAGVPGVVGTLWAVNDLSTAMLIARFYDLWRQQGLPLPQALRQAQRWLRDLYQDKAALAELHSIAEQTRMPAQQAKAFLPQAILRDFSHPYYWASFTFTGL